MSGNIRVVSVQEMCCAVMYNACVRVTEGKRKVYLINIGRENLQKYRQQQTAQNSYHITEQ